MIYADNASTTKMSITAINAMLPYFDNIYGNPSSLYAFGQEAKEALEDCRARVAACLNCEPREITFTSGGSEADNQAIISAARFGAKKGKKHIISTAFEHHAVLHTIKALEKEGFEITLLDPHENGIVRPEELAAAIRVQQALGYAGGMLVVNPIPEEYSMDADVINRAIDQAIADANRLGIKGKETTPYLLARIKDLTGGDSLASNIQLVYNNVRLAAAIAAAL